MPKPPAYRNPETGLLRCPVRNMQDCVKDRCFFWKNSTDIDCIRDSIKPLVPEDVSQKEFQQDNCALLASSLLLDSVFAGFGQLWRAGDLLVFDELWPPISSAREPRARAGAVAALSAKAAKKAPHRPSSRLAADELGSSKQDSAVASTKGMERSRGVGSSDRDRPRLMLVDATVSRRLDTLENQIASLHDKLDALLKKS